MTTRFLRRLAASLVSIAFTVAAHAQLVATHQLRTVVRSGQAAFVGRMEAQQTLQLDLVLPLSDPAGLTQFISQVSDPASPSYRQFVTPQQFTARFGPTQEQYDAVLRFAQNYGLEVVGGSRDGMDVQVKGSVAAIETALHVNMSVYQHPTENRTFFSPDAEPQLDLPFNLWHISGLDNYSLPHPLYEKKSDSIAAHPATSAFVQKLATTGSGPSASYLGSDMRTAYYGAGSLTGAGQNLGLLEYAGINLADVTTYYHNAGQTNSVPISLVSVAGASTGCSYPSCDDTEQTLDVTQALGMAPGLSSLVLYIGAYDTSILAAMTTHSPLPTTIGCSWGWSPADPTSLDPYFEKMAAQGQTFLAAAGDSSTWSASNPAWPADDAYVLSVGGTDLVTASAAGAWKSETAWLDSGGGISSSKTAIPAWQKLSGVVTSTNKGSTTYRNGPDVSANANFTFYVCSDQSGCTANEEGGTSFAAPMWAGYLALVNQQLAASSKPPIGFINPTIYAQNVTSSYAADFHDISSGTSGSYSAVVGYDLVTGWGSPNTGLLAALAGSSTTTTPSFSVAASASSLSVLQGSKGTVTLTTTASGGFKSAVAFTATGAPTGVTLAFSPTSVTGSGTSTLTFTASATAVAGTYTVTVKATSGSIVQTATVSLTITTPPGFALASSTASISLTQGTSGTATVTTTASGGFGAAVALTASGAPSGVTLAFSPTSITGAGSSTVSVTVGPSVAVGTYSITVSGASGSIVHTAKITLAVTIAPGFSVAVSPASLSLAQGTSSHVTFTSTAVGGFKSAVAFTASGAPSGVTLAFSSASVNGAGSSTLTVTVASTVPTGNYSITLSATSGSVVHTAKFTLIVTIAPDFSVTISPATVSVVQGSSGHVTVSSVVVGGFKSAVSFSATGAPTGVTASFSPASVAGAGATTLTFATTSAVTPGSYPITVHAVSGTDAHTATVTLTVTAIPPAFAVKASVASLTVERGHSGTLTVSSTITGAFTSVIALTTTGQGTGNTTAFTPASITGAGSSTLQITIGSASAVGTFTLNISGTGSGVTHTVAIPLTITK